MKNKIQHTIRAGIAGFICFNTTGCYVPITYETTDAANLSSSYSRTSITVDKGVLNVLIADRSTKDSEFRQMKLLSADLTTESGRTIHLKLWTQYYGLGVTYLFRLGDSGYDGTKFSLRVTVSLHGKVSTISGDYDVHEHTKIVDMLEELDHG